MLLRELNEERLEDNFVNNAFLLCDSFFVHMCVFMCVHKHGHTYMCASEINQDCHTLGSIHLAF